MNLKLSFVFLVEASVCLCDTAYKHGNSTGVVWLGFILGM